VAAKVHADHVVPLGIGHVDDRPVPQYPGIVDQHVQRAELVDGPLDELIRAGRGRDVVVARDGRSAGCADLVCDLLCRGGVAARSVRTTAEVVHDDLGSLGGKQLRMLTTEAAACPGDHRNASVECAHTAFLSLAFRQPTANQATH